MEALLSTKFYPPPAPSKIVKRPRLLARLDRPGSLILLSAPPGFGKTTLLGEWRASKGDEISLAWLSLDSDDNDAPRFLAYLIAAVQRIRPEIGIAASMLLQSSPAAPLKTILSSWLNDLSKLDSQVVLVMDDYHVITAQPVHDLVAFILEHQPTALRVIITTRSAPPIPLARWRSRGDLTEIRAEDLRFTPDETEAFLNQLMNLGVSPDDIRALESHTEGWIAGLQMAALAMQGKENVHSLIATFTGGHRFIGDYLAEEVFNRQSPATRDFLLQTSALDRLCAPLCDALTLSQSSQNILDELWRANVFLVPLDDESRWFRYHHLFLEFLRARVQRGNALDIAELHRRASDWFDRNGLFAEAIKHALAAEEYEKAVRLAERHAPVMIASGQVATLIRWMDLLPRTSVETNPRLAVYMATAEFVVGDAKRAERALSHVENSLNQVTGEEAKTIRAEMAAVRLAVSIEQGARPDDIEHAQYLFSHIPRENTFLRAILAYGLGDAYRAVGNMKSAMSAFNESKDIAEAGGNDLAALAARYEIADLLLEQGELHAAETIHRQAIQTTAARIVGDVSLPPLGGVYIGLGKLSLERNDLIHARQDLEKGIRLAEQPGGLGAARHGYLALAFVAQAEGKEKEARHHIRTSEELARHSPRREAFSRLMPDKVRFWLLQGNLAAAARWAREKGGQADLTETEQIALARVWRAQGEPKKLESALQQLGQIRPNIQAQERNGRLVEILLIESLIYHAKERPAQALSALEQCLVLAEPEHYLRTFLDEGQPMLELLGLAAHEGIVPGYVKELMEAFMQGTKPAQPLVEPLSQRELDVLALLADGASNREIAEKLVIAVGTVKRHTLSIYQKLGINSRARAIVRARELNLLR